MPTTGAAQKRGSAAREGGISIGLIVVDCAHLDRMTKFRIEALRCAPRSLAPADGVILKDPKRKGLNLYPSLSPAGLPEEYRPHLDLSTITDPRGEVDRRLRLRATMELPGKKRDDFATLVDPDGTVFDVVDIRWPDARADRWFGRRA